MATSREDVANLALKHLGQSATISSITSTTDQFAVTALALYPTVLDEMFRDTFFSFSTVIAALTLVKTDPNDDWGFSYRYPASARRIRGMLSGIRRDNQQSKIPYRIIKDDAFTIAAITKANPAVVTVTAHGYSTADTISIQDVGGMVQLTNGQYVITKVDANSFSLNGINSSGFTAFTSGGTTQGAALILTDLKDAKAEYGIVVSDPWLYPADFVMALSFRLAAYMAPSVSRDPDLSQLVLRLMEMSRTRAIANSLNEQAADLPPESEFIRGR